MQAAHALLSLLPDSIIRECGSESRVELIIINLIFLTEILLNSVIKCDISREMKQFSDHLLIKTILNLQKVKISPIIRTRYAFKKLNKELFLPAF